MLALTRKKGESLVINNNIEVIRLYESMLAGCVCFIDDDFDSSHAILGIDFNYIKSGDEIDEKIRILRQDPSLLEEILDAQWQYLNKKSKSQWLNEMVSYIEGNL